MNCYSCGSDTGEQLGLCAVCREKRDRQHDRRVSEVGGKDEHAQTPQVKSFSAGHINVGGSIAGMWPAGFWLRFLALWIDSLALQIFLSVLSYIFSYPVFSLVQTALINSSNFLSSSALNADSSISFRSILFGTMFAFVAGVVAVICVVSMLGILYSVLFEASNFRATLGKLVVGIEVVTLNGETLKASQALKRYFAKILSSIPLGVGFLIVAFHPEKVSLHDLLSATRVVKSQHYQPLKIAVSLLVIVMLSAIVFLMPSGKDNNFSFRSHFQSSSSSSEADLFREQLKRRVEEHTRKYPK